MRRRLREWRKGGSGEWDYKEKKESMRGCAKGRRGRKKRDG